VGDDTDRDVRVEYRGTGFYVSLALIFLAALTLLVLAVQNTAVVTVEILTFEFDLPLFAVILGAGLVAVLLDELIGLVWRRQNRARLSDKAELQRLRSELKNREMRIVSQEEQTESDDPQHQELAPPIETTGPDHSYPDPEQPKR
jgi:uncharacterized integral membrane protein